MTTRPAATKRVRTRVQSRTIWIERAIVTYQAFETIDRIYPSSKFAHENNHWTHNVHTILGHETMTNEDKIDALLTLIGRIKAK